MSTPFPKKYLSTSCACVENSLSIEYDRGTPPYFFVLGQVYSAAAHTRILGDIYLVVSQLAYFIMILGS